MSTPDELLARDRAHIIHPYLPDRNTERVIMVSGSGCRLTDANGIRYLDATGGLWLAQIGHGRAELADAAAAQMKTLEYFTSFWEFSNERSIELADRLIHLAPDHFQKVFFTSGGSEGIDAAIRMVRLAHHRRGDTNRTWILSRRSGYHGLAYGGGTATGFPPMKDGMGPMLPDVEHLTPPWPFHSEWYDGQSTTDFCVAELQSTIDRIGAENIAAMVGEPILGVAGMVNPPDDYWSRIIEVLHRNGIFLIFDEVVTAYGRCGQWFAADHYKVKPDIIVTAKGITSGYAPLGAVLVSADLSETLGEQGGFPIGYTYSGHPTMCAVALANLDIIENEGLVERSRSMGEALAKRLARLLDLPVVGEVRQVGMMLGVEIVRGDGSQEPLLPLCNPPLADVIRRETGVIVRGGMNALVLSPPLVLTDDEADEIANALFNVLSRLNLDGTVSPA